MRLWCHFLSYSDPLFKGKKVKKSFYLFTFLPLIVPCFNLEVALRVVANWANLRSLLANYDMAAVSALPDAIAITREDQLVLYVLQELAITLLMMLLNLSNHLKLGCNLLETFLASLFCHAWIHFSPLIVLTSGCSFQILLSILDSTALQLLEP